MVYQWGIMFVVIGSPLGLENSVSDDIFSVFREDSNSRSCIQTTLLYPTGVVAARC